MNMFNGLKRLSKSSTALKIKCEMREKIQRNKMNEE